MVSGLIADGQSNSVENSIELKTASGLGVTILENKASITGGKNGVEDAVGVSVTAGVSVTVGVNVMVGVRVMEGVTVTVGVRVGVGEGGKYRKAIGSP